MKICLVTAFPPSHERLNEYGYHLALELQRQPYLSVTILANEHDGDEAELPGFDVVRCWRPESLANPVKLLRTLSELKPDVVWFNLVLSSFGVNPVAAFLGLCTPALVRMAGFSTHITLHQLMENLALQDAGVRFPWLYRSFGRIATHLLLCANTVTVLLPAYRRTLLRKYHRSNVHLRAHGVFSSTPEYPDFSRRGNPPCILAFGKWGTYKRLELLLEAFPEVQKAIPECRLVIAGENHPTTPGYVESLGERYKGHSHVEIAGYVAEDRIADLFSTASVLVMPYTSATGSSGVAHQASQFGLPIVCADLPDFRDMASEEGLAIDFFRIGDRRSLATALIRLLKDPQRQIEMSEQNYSVAMQATMPRIIRQYLRHFTWQLRAGTPQWRRSLGWRRTGAFGSVAIPWNNMFEIATAPAGVERILAQPEAKSPVCETLPAQAIAIERTKEQKPGRKVA
jgi:glycosyltransferase involved in cell wall biosynthesis